MGLFDSLFPKPVDHFDNKKYMAFRKEMLTHAAHVLERCLHLKSIHRNDEASARAREFIKEIAQDLVAWDEPRFSLFLSIIYDTAWKLGEESFALVMLEVVIGGLTQLAEKGARGGIPIKDLTFVYQRAGMLAARLPDGMQKAYVYYWQAIEAPVPPGCKSPATAQQKATIHALAKGTCDRILATMPPDSMEWQQRSDWHNLKMRELDPHRHWDTPASASGI